MFRQRADVSKLREALDVLARFRNPGDRTFEVEWKFSRVSYFLGRQTPDENKAEKIFESGRDAGNIASSMEPSKPDGYFWYGANLGELSRISPVTVGIKAVGEIKTAMNKVIEIQPDYENSSAYDALAETELTTRIYGGSTDKAIELLEKALQTEKNNMDLHIRLAEAYLAAKRDREAKDQLEQAMRMPPDPDYLPEYKESMEQAKKMLRTKF
ncbi:MAG TPA: tetratricopeptide repeat protein [Pyrinomonadaceae bacterium]|nr:tetratricopeptide repeat protein [Pyrinomonadaceae bacterium]